MKSGAFDTRVRALRRCLITLTIGGLVACASSGFEVVYTSTARFAPSANVEVLTREPSRPYDVLATFRGSERVLCPTKRPYCSLETQARAAGADAIWVKNTHKWMRPERWVMINNQMTRVPEDTYETIEGVLVRYKD